MLRESEHIMPNTPVKSFRINTGFTKADDNGVVNLSLDVQTALTGHPVFTNPPVNPTDLGTQTDALSALMTDARKGGTDRTLAKNIGKQTVVDSLVQDALYCQGLARHDLNTLLTSGYDVVSTNRVSQPLDTPSIVSIDNSVGGQLTVRGVGVLNGRLYQMQSSTDGGATWTNNGNSTGSQRMLLTPTVPGKTYMVEICALGGSTGQSAWSNPVSCMST
jgi:hypothetical protein